MKKYIFTLVILIGLLSFTRIKTTRVSWYGPGFHGKVTANGEIYSQDSLTCASPYMRFGTKVKVTNLANNKSVVVRVNDRGPYHCYVDSLKKVKPYYPLKAHPKRGFDLSKAAFNSISDLEKGVLKVKYEVIYKPLKNKYASRNKQ